MCSNTFGGEGEEDHMTPRQGDGGGTRRKVIIMGAAGRDFHNFNVFFRDNPAYEVVAFTAAQIPGIAGRTYPGELAGGLYPAGIPIRPEEQLEKLVPSSERTRSSSGTPTCLI
jgi:predicted GTPase